MPAEPRGAGAGPKQESRLKITHAQNDARYVALGRMLVLSRGPDYGGELARANRKKNGAPFRYAESLFLSLAAIRSFCGLSFRVLEGVAAESIGRDDAPGYRQIHRRINGVKVSVRGSVVTARGRSGALNMAIDGTGLCPSARSEYIRYRHKVKHGFIKMVLVVDTDTREILAFSVTDDTVGEPPQFEPLACAALKNAGAVGRAGGGAQGASRGTEPGTHPRPSAGAELWDRLDAVMRADGGFDSREIFRLCRRLGITPCIRIDHDATTRSHGISRDRSMAALDQLGGGVTDPAGFARLTKDEREANRKEWKKRMQYGKRWLVEIVISSFKRLFGDSVAARRWDSITQEINLKVNVYNNMLRVQREAIAMA